MTLITIFREYDSEIISRRIDRILQVFGLRPVFSIPFRNENVITAHAIVALGGEVELFVLIHKRKALILFCIDLTAQVHGLTPGSAAANVVRDIQIATTFSAILITGKEQALTIA